MMIDIYYIDKETRTWTCIKDNRNKVKIKCLYEFHSS